MNLTEVKKSLLLRSLFANEKQIYSMTERNAPWKLNTAGHNKKPIKKRLVMTYPNNCS